MKTEDEIQDEISLTESHIDVFRDYLAAKLDQGNFDAVADTADEIAVLQARLVALKWAITEIA